ncbi:MAG TPA: hypothetical protein VKB93_03230 [Thermoanaerobaculia bacterium]|nr:hypothetical protein [Thermoanaerobaculia bacterium]
MVLNPPKDPERLRVIAEIGARQIRYGDVSCDRLVVERYDQWRKGRSVDQVCAELEQKAFAAAVTGRLQEQACELEQCRLSDAELAKYRKPLDDAFVRKAATSQRLQAEAMSRVLKGESAETVYEAVGAQLGQSLEHFKFEIERFEAAWAKPIEVIDRLLAKDFAVMVREGNEKGAKRQAMRAFLRTRIAAIASANGQSDEQAADAYLAELMKKAGVHVVDSRFKLPTGKEVFL